MLVAQFVANATQGHMDAIRAKGDRLTTKIGKATIAPVIVCGSLLALFVALTLATDLRVEDYSNIWWVGVTASLVTSIATLLFPSAEELRALYPKHLFQA